jgi:hypothetical protein
VTQGVSALRQRLTRQYVRLMQFVEGQSVRIADLAQWDEHRGYFVLPPIEMVGCDVRGPALVALTGGGVGRQQLARAPH